MSTRPSTILLNTSHPLYAKLVEFWYVATAGDSQLTGIKGTLHLAAQGGATTVTDGTHGPVGLIDANDEAFSATAGAIHKPSSGTWAAYWVPIETATQYANIFGTSYDNAGSNPYNVAGFYRDNAGGSNGSGISGLCSPGGATVFIPPSPSSIAAHYGTAITSVINCASGAQSIKVNDSSIGTDTAAGSTSTSATSTVQVGSKVDAARNANLRMICCAIFNPPLDATEQTNFHTDPWGLVRPPPEPPELVSCTIDNIPAGTEGVFTTISLDDGPPDGDGTTTHVWGVKDHDGNVVSGATATFVWDSLCDADGPAADYTFTGHCHGWPTASTLTVSIAVDAVSATNEAGTTGNDEITDDPVVNLAENPYLAPGETYYFRIQAVVDGVLSALSNEDAGTFAEPGETGGGGRGRSSMAPGRTRYRSRY